MLKSTHSARPHWSKCSFRFRRKMKMSLKKNLNPKNAMLNMGFAELNRSYVTCKSSFICILHPGPVQYFVCD